MKLTNFHILLFSILVSTSPTPNQHNAIITADTVNMTEVEEWADTLTAVSYATAPDIVENTDTQADITCDDCHNRQQACIDVSDYSFWHFRS
jgi:hypothetical protein